MPRERGSRTEKLQRVDADKCAVVLNSVLVGVGGVYVATSSIVVTLIAAGAAVLLVLTGVVVLTRS
jgi:hypothetical protein